jgi:hypothetical protein
MLADSLFPVIDITDSAEELCPRFILADGKICCTNRIPKGHDQCVSSENQKPAFVKARQRARNATRVFRRRNLSANIIARK